MARISSFLKTSLIGGVIVLLPVAITLGVFAWIYGWIKLRIEPVTKLLVEKGDVQEVLAIVLVLSLIVGVCFVVGAIIKTRVGRFVHETLEERLLKIAPGYTLIKETVAQFLGNRPSPFSSVALCRVFGNDTLVTAFVTEKHDNGMYSVFVPTGPNPTSGNIFHLEAQYVHHIDLPVEDVMRSVISCGAGSDKLITAWAKDHAS